MATENKDTVIAPGEAKENLGSESKDAKTIFSNEPTNKYTDEKLPAEVKIAISDAIIKVKDSLTANFVTILAIFASFITFLGIEIQILKNICDFWRLIGFSILMLTIVLVFVFAIYIFVSQGNKQGWQKIVCMVVLIFALLGATFYSLSKASDEYVCKITQLNNKFEELDAKYSDKNNILLEEINNRVKNLENKAK
jgi:carbon starvation protein CstA